VGAQIRPYTDWDAAAVERIASASEIQVVSFLGAEKAPLFVATVDGEVVGCIWGVLEPTVDLDVAVDRGHRRKGLGRRLVYETLSVYELTDREVTLTVTNPTMERIAAELGLMSDGQGNWQGTISLPAKARPT
jgi:predicted N-acetyltransferase YhbS